MRKYQFINKTVYLEKEKILVIGDMHLGHEFTYRDAGSQIPAQQLEETKKDLTKTFEILKKENKEINKVIFLGDMKHFFAYNRAEKNIILELLFLVGKHVERKNIIIIKGNHEKMAEIADKKLVDYYIEGDIIFIHGDKELSEIRDKKIKMVVMGHLHPAITIQDSQKIKTEKYKCFLEGKYKGKQVLILPSFLPAIEGTSVNLYLNDNRCFISKRILQGFNVHAIGKDVIFDFGKLGKLS